MIYGALRHSVPSVNELNESNARIYKLFVNSSKDAPLPPNGMHVYTGVKDVALAHIRAATVPEASGHRFVICEGQISSQEISDILRKNIPELEERTPVGVPGANKLDPNAYTCSSKLAKEVLGVTFRSKEDTFVDLARQLLEIEKKEKL